MMDTYYQFYGFEAPPIVKPNLITGEGRSKPRPFSAHKQKDLKKSKRRNIAKKSKRLNRR